MENIPVELLEKILLHFNNSLPELLSISAVSRQWHSLITNDELFLNKWTQRRFAHYPAIQLTMEESYWKGREINDDIPPFPCPLSSSLFIVRPESYYRSHSIPAIQGDYSLAFWIFNIPGKGELNFRVNSKSTDQLHWFHYDKCYHSAYIDIGGMSYSAEDVPIDSSYQWCHFVVNVRQGGGGQVSLWCNHHKYELEKDNCSMRAPKEGDFIEVECSYRFWVFALVDVRLFPFCLTPAEIYSVYEQERTFDLVEVGAGRKNVVNMYYARAVENEETTENHLA